MTHPSNFLTSHSGASNSPASNSPAFHSPKSKNTFSKVLRFDSVFYWLLTVILVAVCASQNSISAQTDSNAQKKFDAAVKKAELDFQKKIEQARKQFQLDLKNAHALLKPKTVTPKNAIVTVNGAKPTFLVSVMGDQGWSEVPDIGQRASIYVPEKSEPKDGVVEFTVHKNREICLVASWAYDGNSSGGWTEGRLFKKDLIEQGWKEVGEMYFNLYDRHTIFSRNCKAGESFRIRTRKYYRPYVMVPNVMTKTPKIPKHKMPDPNLQIEVAKSKQTTAAEILEPSFPKKLENTIAYASPLNGTAIIKTYRRCELIVAISWQYDGNSNGQWTEEKWNRDAMIEDGWEPMGKVGIKHRGSSEKHELFVKTVEANKKLRIRSRKYGAPYVFVSSDVMPDIE